MFLLKQPWLWYLKDFKDLPSEICVKQWESGRSYSDMIQFMIKCSNLNSLQPIALEKILAIHKSFELGLSFVIHTQK